MAGRFDVVAFLKLFRFPLVFTAIADSATGYLICTSRHEINAAVLACLAIASSGLYFFGMALNDIADRNRDKELAPTRVLPSGRLTLNGARVAAFLVLACSLTATLLIPDTSIVQRSAAWGLVVFFICAYNLFLKIPPTMGLVRACNLLLGVVAARRIGFDLPGQPWQYAMMALPALVYVSSLTYVSTLEEGGPARVKLTLGTLLMVVGAGLAALAGPAVERFVYFAEFSVSHPWALLIAGVLAAWLVRRALGARDRKGIMLLVRDGVGGIILLDAALLASFDGPIPAIFIAALVIPAVLSVALFKRLA